MRRLSITIITMAVLTVGVGNGGHLSMGLGVTEVAAAKKKGAAAKRAAAKRAAAKKEAAKRAAAIAAAKRAEAQRIAAQKAAAAKAEAARQAAREALKKKTAAMRAAANRVRDPLASAGERRHVKNRSKPHHAQLNGVYVLGEAFKHDGRLTDFVLFDDDKQKLDQFITPMVFRPAGSRWQLIAVGQSMRSIATGTQRFPFIVEWGSGRVEKGDRFGWRDGQIGFDSRGLIDHDVDSKAPAVLYLGNKHESFETGAAFNVAKRLPHVYSIDAHVVPNGDSAGYRQRLEAVLGYRHEFLSRLGGRDPRAKAEAEAMMADPSQATFIERAMLNKKARREYERAMFYVQQGKLDLVRESLHKITTEHVSSSYAGRARGYIALIDKRDQLPRRTVSRIRSDAAQFKAVHGQWPTPQTSQKWFEIDASLRLGLSGLEPGSSLDALLEGR